MIKDSGNRTEFESGAVRDIQSGKGRCDLLPLDIAAQLFMDDPITSECLWRIGRFVETLDVTHIRCALNSFVRNYYGTMATALLEVSIHYEEGALKYGEHNWEKGIPIHSYVDSAVRHLLKICRGDDDEDHKRAFIWNLLGLMWTMKHKPELNDIGGV